MGNFTLYVPLDLGFTFLIHYNQYNWNKWEGLTSDISNLNGLGQQDHSRTSLSMDSAQVEPRSQHLVVTRPSANWAQHFRTCLSKSSR